MSIRGIVESTTKRLDGWINAFTGLGTLGRDKVLSTDFEVDPLLVDVTLGGMYRSDDMAARIVDQVPLDALRPGVKLVIANEEKPVEGIADGQKQMDFLAEFNGLRSLAQAWIWGRLFGGGAVWAIFDDAEQDEPLNTEKGGRLVGFQVFERRELFVQTYYEDPLEANFGQPEIFRLQAITASRALANQSVLIHESRLILFEGVAEPRTIASLPENGWGGASVLQRTYNALRGFNVFWQSVTHLTQDASQAVFKLKNLCSILAGGNKEELNTRMALTDMSRSTARAILVDADNEDFKREPHNFAGIDGLAQQFAHRLAAAARMPVTVLMGQSPAGMNATGESDLTIWYDQVEQIREADFRPQLERLILMGFIASNGPTGQEPESWRVEFRSLRALSDVETADLRKTVAETDVMLINANVLLPEEVATSRYPVTGWSPDTVIDTEEKKKILALEQARELAEAQGGITPPTPPAPPAE